MCTSITYHTQDHYFGRNLDYERSYGENITITPRDFVFSLRHEGELSHHYAIIGMATVISHFPLYYDATNECGLSIAGLNFSGYAQYSSTTTASSADRTNAKVTSFELIPWLLGTCKDVRAARVALEGLTITDESFVESLPASPLHWMIADRDECIVYEYTKDGGKIYENPVGVMTNNPSFEYHMTHLQDFLHVSHGPLMNNLLSEASVEPYSRGMGAMGLPGDLSSASRFVRAAYTKLNSLSDADEASSVQQFFSILDSVAQAKGCCYLGDDEDGHPQYEYTLYSSCCNVDKGIYYYKTHENSHITAVHLFHEDLDSTTLKTFPLEREWKAAFSN